MGSAMIWHPYCSFQMQADSLDALQKAVALPKNGAATFRIAQSAGHGRLPHTPACRKM